MTSYSEKWCKAICWRHKDQLWRQRILKINFSFRLIKIPKTDYVFSWACPSKVNFIFNERHVLFFHAFKCLAFFGFAFFLSCRQSCDNSCEKWPIDLMSAISFSRFASFYFACNSIARLYWDLSVAENVLSTDLKSGRMNSFQSSWDNWRQWNSSWASFRFINAKVMNLSSESLIIIRLSDVSVPSTFEWRWNWTR